MKQYDVPGSVETEIFGISDATGALKGNFTDAGGVRRGFSGDEIIEVPGATATYADFVNASGFMVGSYVDAEGIYDTYVRSPDNTFINYLAGISYEYLFIHGITDSRLVVSRCCSTRHLHTDAKTSVGVCCQWESKRQTRV